MKDSWSTVVAARLRQAARNPPGADVLRPQVQQLAHRAVQQAVVRGQRPRLSVQATRSRISVHGAPGSGPALEAMRRELARNRREFSDTVRREAQARIRGAT